MIEKAIVIDDFVYYINSRAWKGNANKIIDK